MTKSYKLVVFDWEGTLGDPLSPIVQAFIEESRRLELGVLDAKDVRSHIILGPIVAIKKLFPHLSTCKQSDFLQAVQTQMLAHSAEVNLTPGALHVLEKIKHAGISMAIATNRGQQGLLRDMEVAGLADYFMTTRSASQSPPKPCPQMLEEIMAICCVAPVETLMVGDSTSDIEMAKKLRVEAIGVDFYFQNEDALRSAGASAVFHDFLELEKHLGLQ